MSNVVTVNGVDSPLITHKAQPVCTTQQLAQFYGCTEKNLGDNYAYQRERFDEGKHFIKLEGEALRAFKQCPGNSGLVAPRTASLILWTEIGAARHAKMLTTEKAWEVFEEMECAYFRSGADRYTARRAIAPIKATAEAARAFAPLVRVARLLGCDKNAAAISANQAIYSMTNINLMQQLGHTHLEAEKQDGHWYTPTELGKQMTPPVSARQVNLLLAEAGLQFKRGDVWEASDAGKDFARIYDTGKRHGSGVAVTQMKWSATVVAVLQALPQDQKEVA